MSGYNADASQPRERDEEDAVLVNLADAWDEYTASRSKRDEETVDVTPSAEFQIQALNGTVARLEREKGYEEEKAKRYRRLLVRLAEDTLSLAESLDYEIGDSLKATLTELADCHIIDLPTKSVTITGSYTREYEYNLSIDVPLFSDTDEIDHNDYIDEIVEDIEGNEIDWTLIPGETYNN